MIAPGLSTGTMRLLARINVGETAFDYPQPSAPALFLSVSYRAHCESRVAFQNARFGENLVEASESSYASMFDFFEARVQHIVFAFTALEAYANESIPDPFVWNTKNRSGVEVEYDREQTERYVSLDEKLGHILPKLLTKESIKSGVLWHRFKMLKKLRDRLIHPKHFDSRARPESDVNSIWADIFNTRTTDFSAQVHDIIMHFGGGARTWAKKFPYEGLIRRAAKSTLRSSKNARKREKKKRR
ncbi:hypothetical protein JYT22_01035 [Endomicrobium sp. AH-315-J14]|nr:hypothetical protein [Endomicrobium sp. AH-315-J14]